MALLSVSSNSTYATKGDDNRSHQQDHREHHLQHNHHHHYQHQHQLQQQNQQQLQYHHHNHQLYHQKQSTTHFDFYYHQQQKQQQQQYRHSHHHLHYHHHHHHHNNHQQKYLQRQQQKQQPSPPSSSNPHRRLYKNNRVGTTTIFNGTIIVCIQLLCCLSTSIIIVNSSKMHMTQRNNHANISELLDNLLRGYDNSVRPGVGGTPAVIEVDIVVRSMGPISEVDMSYSMDCYFRQSWVDRRLAFTGAQDTLALSISMLGKIWKPDTYFYNGKQSYLHTITTPNKFVRLHQDGKVLYSSRLTIKAGCPMNLEDFPMDVQRCPLKFGSFGYTASDVIYKWKSASQAVTISEDMKLSQFDLVDHPVGNITDIVHRSTADEKTKIQKNFVSEYSMLFVNFHLQRHMGNFLIQVYGPCVLLVVLSWVSFWLNREATADRVSLGITTVLTMTFLGLEARTDLPKVSYPTALDFFVFLSFAFIFATIIQFAVVHYFTKYGSGECYFSRDDFESESDDNSDTNNDESSLHQFTIDGRRETNRRMFEVIPLASCSVSLPTISTSKLKRKKPKSTMNKFGLTIDTQPVASASITTARTWLDWPPCSSRKIIQQQHQLQIPPQQPKLQQIHHTIPKTFITPPQPEPAHFTDEYEDETSIEIDLDVNVTVGGSGRGGSGGRGGLGGGGGSGGNGGAFGDSIIGGLGSDSSGCSHQPLNGHDNHHIRSTVLSDSTASGMSTAAVFASAITTIPTAVNTKKRLSFQKNTITAATAQSVNRAKRNKRMPRFNSVSKIDRASRIFFPLVFFFINLFYWYSYLKKSERFIPPAMVRQ